MLEKQLKVVPDYDKYNLILGDLYSTLEQDDYYLGKNNTVVIDKAVTFSQFRMWEEVNEELNNALSNLYSHDNYSVDLAYANEFDQKIWEEIHSESIVQIGDLDRQKFFSTGMNKYGGFKSEFQKWMVLGKSHQKFPCFDTTREKLCQEWCSLPKFVDQIHYNKLTKFQENIELNESMALLHSTRGEAKDKYLKDFSTAAMIQRDRILVKCESHKVCKDILENRYIPFNLLNSANDNRNRQGESNDQANKNKFAFKRLLNYVWDKLIIARQARKQNVLEVSKRFLVDIELHIKRSDDEGLKGISLQKEKYLLIQERMKLILHYFRNYVKLNLKEDEFIMLRSQLISKALNMSEKKHLNEMRKLGENVLKAQNQDEQNESNFKLGSDHSNDDFIVQLNPEMWESEIYRLRGEIFMEDKNYDKANESFLQSIELCSTSSKNWRSLALAGEKFALMAEKKEKSHSEIIDWVCTAVEGYLKSLKQNLFNSRLYIVKILDLVSTYAKYDTDGVLVNSFQEVLRKTQMWVWIFWIPQLLEFILKTKSEYEIATLVLSEITKHYPQPMFYALRLYFWYRTKEGKYKLPEIKTRMNTLGKKLYNIMNSVSISQNIKEVIDGVIKQLQKRFVSSKEEELLSVFESGYSRSLLKGFRAQNFFIRVWTDLLVKHDEKDFIGKTLKEQFIKDFMDPESTEPKIASYSLTYYQEKLKKWKDILSRRLTLKGTPQNLVEISKDLANFNYRLGMELPGQYLELDSEPFLNTRILITRFETKVSQNSGKRIIMRTNSGKRLTYSISNNNRALENPTKIDERLTQFKVFMNKIFMYMYPETMRRGIRFGVNKKILFPFTKLCEDYGVSTLDEIYEIACSSSGLDPDTANVLFSRDIKEILKKKMGDEIPNLEESELEKVTKDCNTYMRKLIEDEYLSNHFKNLLKTVDEFFMFRKQFTNYFASNSYLTHCFKLNNNYLKNLKVCTEHGRVFHNELVISYNKERTSLDNTNEQVPFRLSDNIKDFISEIGLNSLFPGVMTVSCMAVKSKETFVRSYLKLFFEEDPQVKGNKDELVEDVMKRALSIAKPHFDKDVSQLDYCVEEESKKKNIEKEIMEAKEKLKKFRFNKVAYDLIQEAGNPDTLHKMHPLFVSWF